MNADEAKKLHDSMLAPDEGEATTAPYTDEELELIRARARGDQPAEELICVDYWADELKPKGLQPRPGYLMHRGSPIAGGCRFVLHDALFIRGKREEEGWKRWSEMTIKHKNQCQACQMGTSLL